MRVKRVQVAALISARGCCFEGSTRVEMTAEADGRLSQYDTLHVVLTRWVDHRQLCRK